MQSLPSIDSVDNLAVLFIKMMGEGQIQYLRANSDHSLGYPTTFENIFKAIKERGTELGPPDHPLNQALSQMEENFKPISTKQNALSAILLNRVAKNGTEPELERLLQIHSPNVAYLGENPIHGAVEKGNTDTIFCLIKHDANLNVLNSRNQTPLEIAIAKGDFKHAGVLLRSGANPNLMTSSKASPLNLAIQREDFQMVDLLIRHGAKVNQRDQNGKLPLEVAHSSSGNREWVMDLLMTNGAMPTLANINGKTLVDTALEEKNLPLIRLCESRTLFSPEQMVKSSTIKVSAALASVPPKTGVEKLVSDVNSFTQKLSKKVEQRIEKILTRKKESPIAESKTVPATSAKSSGATSLAQASPVKDPVVPVSSQPPTQRLSTQFSDKPASSSAQQPKQSTSFLPGFKQHKEGQAPEQGKPVTSPREKVGLKS
jgi:hypothetical protein